MSRFIRAVGYGAAGALIALLLGQALRAVTGMACTCFLGDPWVALRYGVLGGVFFSFIYRPNLFATEP